MEIDQISIEAFTAILVTINVAMTGVLVILLSRK